MPVYEYICLDCRTPFEALRPMAEADTAIACEHCESDRTSRTLSVFYAQSNGQPMPSHSTASCACGGACSCTSLN